MNQEEEWAKAKRFNTDSEISQDILQSLKRLEAFLKRKF